MSVGRRFDDPDNIRVVFADEDAGGTDNGCPRMELINSIRGHDGGPPRTYFTGGSVSVDPLSVQN
jgi:hypothetical protein